MADQNGTPPGSKGPYNPLNVFGEQVTVRYAGAGPKEGGSDKNDKGDKDLEKSIDNLAKHIDNLGELISKNLSTAGSLTGGLGNGPGGGGGNEKGSGSADRFSADAYYNSIALQSFVNNLTKTAKKYEEDLDEIEDRFEAGISNFLDTTGILVDAFRFKVERVISVLGEFRTKMSTFLGDFFSGTYAFEYFSEALKASSEAATRGIGSITDFFNNIISFGPSYSHTLEVIKQNLEDGGMAFARSGLSVTEFGKALRDNRNALNKETNADAYLDAKEQDQLMLDSFETLYKQGIVKSITDKKVIDYSAKQLESLKEISKSTGLSLKELIKMQQQKNVSIEEAILAGDYTGEDAVKIQAKYNALLKANPALAAEFAKLVAQRGNEALAFGDDPNFGLNMATGRYDALKKIFSGEGSIPELLWEAGQEYEKRLKQFGPDIYRLPGLGGSGADFLQVAAALKGFKPNNETMEKINTTVEEIFGWFQRTFGIDMEFIKGGFALLSAAFGGITWLTVMGAIIDTAANTLGIWVTLAKDAVVGGGILGLLKNTVLTIAKAVPIFAAIFGWVSAIQSAFDMWRMTPEDIKRWGNDSVGQFKHALHALLPLIAGIATTILLVLGAGVAGLPALIAGGIAAGLVSLIKYFSEDGTFATAINSFITWLDETIKSFFSTKSWSDWWNGTDSKKPAPHTPPPKPTVPKAPSQKTEEETMQNNAPTDFSDPVVTALQELKVVLNSIANNTRAGLRYSTQ